MTVEVDVLADLVAMPPGPGLAAALGGLTLSAIPNDRVIDVLQAQHRQLAHEQARMVATIVEMSRTTPYSDPDDPDEVLVRGLDEPTRSSAVFEWACGELAAALTWTDGSAAWELGFATTLRALPQVFTALWDGRIDRPKAKVFTDHLDPTFSGLTAPQIETICTRLVPLASGLTTRQLTGRLLRMILAIDPQHARRRYRRAVCQRNIALYLDPTGTAAITAEGLPAAEATAACERLDKLAAKAKQDGHPGTIAQIAADVFLGMLDGRYHGLSETQIITDLLLNPRPEDTHETAADAGAGAGAGGEDTTSGAGTGDPTGSDATGFDDGPATGAGADADNGNGNAGNGNGNDDSGIGDSGDPAQPVPVVPVPVPVGPRTGIEIRVGLSTLLGLDERPAELPGLGPVIPDVARAAVAAQHRGAEWRFAITDESGYLILAGVTRRRPRTTPGAPVGRCRGGIVEIQLSATDVARYAQDPALTGRWAGVVADLAGQYARRDQLTTALNHQPDARFARGALARHIQIRDRTCTHPGCARPAGKSDLDHTRDHQYGGRTTAHNLGPGCARHHLFKHELGWLLTQPEPGHFEWISPLGEVYRTRGEPITIDLPDPLPRPITLESAADDDAVGSEMAIWVPRKQAAPKPDAPRPPPAIPDEDDEPPF